MVRNYRNRSLLIVLALLVTWLVWGSSFVAISYTLESMPPLLMMSTRFIVAGGAATVVGLVLAARAGRALPCRRAWRDATVVGAGFITVGMGATAWAATRLPSGINGLLVASAPLWIALLQATFLRGGVAASSRARLLGLLVGMTGVAVLVAPSGDGGGAAGGVDLVAALVLVGANAAWAAASLFAPRAVPAGGLVLGVGMQMLTGGALLLGAALATGEAGRFDVTAISPLAAESWVYLVVVASLGGFLAYGWLLEQVSASTASTHAFVNPLVAVALGALLLGEQVGPKVLVAGAAIVTAVVLLLVGEARIAGRIADVATPLADEPTEVPTPVRVTGAPARSAARARRAASATRALAASRGSRSGGRGWSPAPTPAFAGRRAPRPWQATDGMDALAIDEALDQIV